MATFFILFALLGFVLLGAATLLWSTVRSRPNTLVPHQNELLMLKQQLTELQSSKAELEHKLDHLSGIIESAEYAIIGLSTDLKIVSWNQAAEKLYGYTGEEIMTASIDALIPQDRKHEIQGILDQVLEGTPVKNFETVRLRKDGVTINVSLTVSPIKDHNGHLMGASSIVRDITKRKEMEAQILRYQEHLEELVSERTKDLIASQEQLRQSERMASIGALAAGIAHEINNPIGAILLAAQNAIEQREALRDKSEYRTVLENTCEGIISNARRCARIVRGVLQFSRREETVKWAHDLNALVSSSAHIINQSVRTKGVRLMMQLGKDLPKVVVNPVEIEQVVINLVKNAIDSSIADSEVIVATSLEGDYALLSVKDTGRGISTDEQKRIFDPFYTTRLRDGGTGLGLSLVHGIVSSHGGSIAVHSELGKGTTMTVRLPLHVQDSAQSIV